MNARADLIIIDAAPPAFDAAEALFIGALLICFFLITIVIGWMILDSG